MDRERERERERISKKIKFSQLCYQSIDPSMGWYINQSIDWSTNTTIQKNETKNITFLMLLTNWVMNRSIDRPTNSNFYLNGAYSRMHVQKAGLTTRLQERLANANGSARQRPLVNRNTGSWLKMAHFSYPSLIRRLRSLSSRWNFAVKLCVRKLESWGYSVVKVAWS